MRGVVSSVLQLLGEGATHVGVATDHVIESFRNDLWPGYKTGEGVDPDLWSQAWPLEAALARSGSWCGRWSSSRRTTPWRAAPPWPTTIPRWSRSSSAPPTRISGQCVRGTRVVQLDRRKDV